MVPAVLASRPVERTAGLTLADVDAVRILLRGGSVVDWHRMNLATEEEAAGFLRVNGLDPEEPAAQARLRDLLWRSVEYLEANFDYHFPPALTAPGSAPDLLLRASSRTDPWRGLACVILKVMHIMNHVEATELRHRLPVSEEVLYKRAADAMDQAVIDLQAGGVPLLSYSASRKSRDSLITKLLSRRTTTAAQVFDRVRCRLVAREPTDIVPVLAALKDRILPYNYVVPGQSRNEIVRNDSLVEASVADRPTRDRLRIRLALEDAVQNEDWNRFSAAAFKMINFVVEMPIPVPDLVRHAGDRSLEALGFLVFQPVEFQVFDEATWNANEHGEGSHARYKDRQRWEVIRRLEFGGPFGGAGGPAFTGRART